MARRRNLALAALASLLAGLIVAVSGTAPAEAKVIHKPAPASSVANPMPGEQYNLTGKLGRSVARYLIVQRKSGRKWVSVQKKWAPRSGRYVFTVTQPSATTSWRVIARTTRVARKTYSRTVTKTRTLTQAGQWGTITGAEAVRTGAGVLLEASFSPIRPQRPVQFQVNTGAGWQALYNGVEGPAGRSRYLWASGTPGVFQFRAVAWSGRGAADYTTGPVNISVIAKAPAVAAHRGYSGLYPENTLAAYSSALGNQADFLETDFQRTAPDTAAESLPYVDGTGVPTADPGPAGTPNAANPNYCSAPDAIGLNGSAGTTGWKSNLAEGKQHFIALHDDDFGRTTNVFTVFPPTNPDGTPSAYAGLYEAGQPVVEKFTLCQIKKLDAGSWKGAQYAGQPVPSLEETLDLITVNTLGRNVMFEPKLSNQTEADALYDEIVAYDAAHASNPAFPNYKPFVVPGDDAAGHADRALFDTFDFSVATQLTAHSNGAAEVATIADSDAEVDPAKTIAAGAKALFVKDSLVTQARIDALHAAGIQVFVWTVNNESRWYQLAAMSTDGIITDNPKGMRKQFADMGLV